MIFSTSCLGLVSTLGHYAMACQTRLKYWVPIHYDTIEDGQNKKSHLLLSFLVRIVLFFILSAMFICQKYYYIISLVSFE